METSSRSMTMQVPATMTNPAPTSCRARSLRPHAFQGERGRGIGKPLAFFPAVVVVGVLCALLVGCSDVKSLPDLKARKAAGTIPTRPVWRMVLTGSARFKDIVIVGVLPNHEHETWFLPKRGETTLTRARADMREMRDCPADIRQVGNQLVLHTTEGEKAVSGMQVTSLRDTHIMEGGRRLLARGEFTLLGRDVELIAVDVDKGTVDRAFDGDPFGTSRLPAGECGGSWVVESVQEGTAWQLDADGAWTTVARPAEFRAGCAAFGVHRGELVYFEDAAGGGKLCIGERKLKIPASEHSSTQAVLFRSHAVYLHGRELRVVDLDRLETTAVHLNGLAFPSDPLARIFVTASGDIIVIDRSGGVWFVDAGEYLVNEDAHSLGDAAPTNQAAPPACKSTSGCPGC